MNRNPVVRPVISCRGLAAACSAAIAIALAGASFLAAAEEGRPVGERVEKTAKRAGKFVEKTATRAGKFTEKTAKRAGKFVEKTATKTGEWVKRQTE